MKLIKNSHHIIPKAVYRQFDDLAEIIARDATGNRIDLVSKFHGKHPAYSTWITKKLIAAKGNGKLTPDKVEQVLNEARTEINKALNYWIDSDFTVNMNSYFKIKLSE